MHHDAMRIVFPDVDEFFFRLFVPERMQERDSALEGLLHRSGARNWKMNRAQLRLRQVFVVMVIFIVVAGSGNGR